MKIKQYFLKKGINYRGYANYVLNKIPYEFQCRTYLDLINLYILVEYSDPTYINEAENYLRSKLQIINIKEVFNDEISTSSSDEIQSAIHDLQKIAYSTLFSNPSYSMATICSMIKGASREIRLYFLLNNKTGIRPGDVVVCDMGFDFDDELRGDTHAIVCKISSIDRIYIAPIREYYSWEGSPFPSYYVPFDATVDIPKSPNCYSKGIVLLDRLLAINTCRVSAVIGKTTPSFFKKVLKQLASTFDFTNKSNPQSIESALMKVVGSAILDYSKPAETQIIPFLSDIGMETQPLIIEAFKIACLKNFLTLKEIVEYLSNKHPNLSQNQIRSILRKTFKLWISKHTNLSHYKNISLIHLIKIFVKKFYISV